jgi:membrane protein YdbS with pleckstrin-like domain
VLYEIIKQPLLQVLRAPEDPPQPPRGSADSVQIFKASPRFLTLKLVVHFASMATALGFELLLWALSPDSSVAMALGITSAAFIAGTFALTLLRYFLIRLEYDMRFYVLTDRSLRIRRGAMTIEESTYTFANVQNLTLRQGPLERLFGLAHLHIDTAGGRPMAKAAPAADVMDHRGRVDGIDGANARALRDQILKWVTRHRDSGLGDADDSRSLSQAPSRNEERRAALLRAVVSELRQLNGDIEHKRQETGPS